MNLDDPSPEQRAILDRRSREVARPLAAEAMRVEIDAVLLRVAGERYAIPSRIVHGVAALRRLAPIPGAGPDIAGMFALRGRVMPVFHLRAILDVPLAALPEHGRIVLVGATEPELALVVDAAEGVRAVEEAGLEPAPEKFGPAARALVRGIDHDGVPVLDADALLASPRLVVDIALPNLPFRGTR